VSSTSPTSAARALRALRIMVDRQRTLFMLRREAVTAGADLCPWGRPIITRCADSAITLGAHVLLISNSRSTALGVAHPVILRTLRAGATIEIGDDVGLSGTSIVAAHSVRVGSRVLFGADVMIADTDFHPLEWYGRRYSDLPEPGEGDGVVIGDDVFVGARATILKGTTIGSGSVIGAGSVVSGTIPARCVAAGSPAKVVRMLDEPDQVTTDGSTT
jgi:acetyltransferase-like isoleucine patch superfamily enzyme